MTIEGSTVLVTGANGFVGTGVCARLAAAGARVHALVRRPTENPALERRGIEQFAGDFTDAADAARAVAGTDAVVHCAATVGPDLQRVRAVNTEGTRTVLHAATRGSPRRFVHVSTAAVYDDPRPEVVDEDAPTVTGGSPYALTKAEAEAVVRNEGPGLETVVLRPPAILGAHPTSTWGARVPQRVRDGAWPLVDDGAGTFAWVHVDDVAEAVLLALTESAAVGSVYNVVGGHAAWRDYVGRIRSWFAAGEAPREQGEAWTGRFDTRRIERELGWRPRVTFDDAMSEIEGWWQQRGRNV